MRWRLGPRNRGGLRPSVPGRPRGWWSRRRTPPRVRGTCRCRWRGSCRLPLLPSPVGRRRAGPCPGAAVRTQDPQPRPVDREWAGRSPPVCTRSPTRPPKREGAAGADAVGQSEKRVVAGCVMSGDRCCHDFGGGVDVVAHEGAVEADAMAQNGTGAEAAVGDLAVEADTHAGCQERVTADDGELPDLDAGANDDVVIDDRGGVDPGGGVDAARGESLERLGIVSFRIARRRPAVRSSPALWDEYQWPSPDCRPVQAAGPRRVGWSFAIGPGRSVWTMATSSSGSRL